MQSKHSYTKCVLHAEQMYFGVLLLVLMDSYKGLLSNIFFHAFTAIYTVAKVLVSYTFTITLRNEQDCFTIARMSYYDLHYY